MTNDNQWLGNTLEELVERHLISKEISCKNASVYTERRVLEGMTAFSVTSNQYSVENWFETQSMGQAKLTWT